MHLHELVETIPNRVTLVRLTLLPILWMFFLLHLARPLAIGLAVAYATDKLDGLLARLLEQKSRFGDAMDSVADHLLFPSIVVWLVVLRPSAYSSHKILGVVAVACYLITIALGLLRSRRFGGVHVLSAKLLGLVGYSFAVWAFWSDASSVLYYMTIILVFCFSVETCIYHFRADLFQNQLHSLVLGITRVQLKGRFLRYLL